MLDLEAELELVNKQIAGLIARIAERRDHIESLELEGHPTNNAKSLLHFMEGVLLHRYQYRQALQDAVDARADRA